MAGSDGKSLPATFKVSKGDEVVICGKVVNYNDSKPETEGKGSAIIVSVNGKDTKGTAINGGDNSGSGDNNNGSGDNGGDNNSGNMTKSIAENVITFVSGTPANTPVSVDLNAQGWANQAIPTTVTLEDGTTIDFSKGEGGTDPKFYTATKGVRCYAKNTITIKSTSKNIAKVVVTCDTYLQNNVLQIGNEQLYAAKNDKTVTICNEWTGTSGGTQLRAQKLDIYYAQ